MAAEPIRSLKRLVLLRLELLNFKGQGGVDKGGSRRNISSHGKYESRNKTGMQSCHVVVCSFYSSAVTYKQIRHLKKFNI